MALGMYVTTARSDAFGFRIRLVGVTLKLTSFELTTAMTHSMSVGLSMTTSVDVLLPSSHWNASGVGAASLAMRLSLYQNSPTSSLLNETMPSNSPAFVGTNASW